MSDQQPEAVIERFSQLLADGNLDAMVELYEPDATFAFAARARASTDAMRSARR